jgi:hypothetical protein
VSGRQQSRPRPAEKIFSGHALATLLPTGYNTTMRTNEHKQRAAELGLDWGFCLALYREARELEAADVDRRTADRREAFQAVAGTSHGGHVKALYRHAFRDGGDCTSVAGIDVAAAGRGMTADELFEHLATDAPELRPADDVMAEAIARAARMTGAADVAAADDAADLVPLVSGALTADVTEQWMRQLVKAGRVRGRKAGRNWLVSLADCQAFRRHPTAGRPRSAPF